MHRAALAGLLLVCLAIFLCPAVGKPNFVSLPQKHSCCAQKTACAKPSQQYAPSRGACGGEKSQPTDCCPIPCSALVLLCTTADRLSFPTFSAQLIFTSDTTAADRVDRPPVPPPRA